MTWFCQLALWFQPLFWLLRRELQACQDFVADHRAADAGREAVEYSELLLELSRQHMGRPVIGAISLIDRSSQLSRRIKMLLASPVALRSCSPIAFYLAAAALSVSCAVLVSTLRLDTAEADAAAPPAKAANGAAQTANSRGDDESEAQAKIKVVRGRVVDESGMPVGDARLWLPLRYKPRRIAEGTTDASGRFQLRFPADWISPHFVGSGWTIWAYAPDHGIATNSPYDVVRGKSEEEIEIELPPKSNTRFKVLTPQGEPLAGALVEPQNYQTTVGYELVPDEMFSAVSTRTDTEGLALLSALRLKPFFRVCITSDKFGKQTLRVDRDIERPVREIRLRDRGRIQGRLVGERAEWLRGVKLGFSVDNHDEWSDAQGIATIVTTADGSFDVPVIASGGPVHIYVDLDPSLPVRPRLPDRLFLAAGETLRLELPLTTAPKVHGNVVAKSSGKPVAGAEISLGYGGYHQSDNVVTDDQGRFEGRALPSSVRVHIISLPDGYVQLGAPWAESYRVPDGVERFELPTIEVVGSHKLSGQLVGQNDEPLSRREVMAVTENRRYGFAKTDSEGRFSMSVPDGIDTTIEVYSDERGQEPVAVVSEAPLIVRYSGDAQKRALEAKRRLKPDVALTGRVLLGGKPLSGVSLSLSVGIPVERPAAQAGNASVLGGAVMQMRHLASSTTDAEGRYRLNGLKAGDSYNIAVKPPLPACDPTWQHQMPFAPKLHEGARGEVSLPDINLRKLTQSLAGKVVDPDGNPVVAAQVTVMLRNGMPLSGSSLSVPPWTETDQEGRFTLQQLPDEPLAVMAHSKQEARTQIRFPAKLNVEINQRNIRIVLDPSLTKEEQ